MSRRFQFSIRFLLLATVAVAAGTAAVRAEPSFRSTLLIDALTVVFATAAVIAVMQTEGAAKSFWVGTAMVLGAAFIMAAFSGWAFAGFIMGNGPDSPSYWIGTRALGALWCAAPINGLFAVFLHWLFPHKDTGP